MFALKYLPAVLLPFFLCPPSLSSRETTGLYNERKRVWVVEERRFLSVWTMATAPIMIMAIARQHSPSH